MGRTSGVWLAGLLLLLPGTAHAQADALAGNWKVSVLNQGQQTFWLITLEAKDGKWTGKVADTANRVPPTTLDELKVSGDQVRFLLKMEGRAFGFEGKMPKGKADKILGSIELGRQILPAELEATKITSFKDTYEASKELLARNPNSPEAFDAYVEMLSQATAKKAKPEEVRGWAEKAFKTAELYGPRWQRQVGLRIAEALAGQEGHGAVALEYARKMERLLEPNEEPATQIRVLEVLAMTLKKTGKAEETKEIEARIDKLEAKDDQEFLKKFPPLKVDAFAGRKGKSDRVVLVELFTGAQCPPCVAADLAFDALEKTYKARDVVLLEYHLHIPGPDPLTNADSEARASYYGEEIEGTPTIMFNGKSEAGGGGPVTDALKKYKEYRTVIDALLEKPTKVKLKLDAVPKRDKIDISAEASGFEEGGKLSLRLALVEEEVRYQGGNQMRFHHRVVRALPGSAKGMALKGKTGKYEVSVDLGELRKTLTTYLDEYGKKREFPDAKRPMNFKQLSVVAFVQNDETKEVLQAAQVEVGAKSATR